MKLDTKPLRDHLTTHTRGHPCAVCGTPDADCLALCASDRTGCCPRCTNSNTHREVRAAALATPEADR